jgi:Arc/MetJ-type ribon-helix-helix transcriptional regulator
MTQRKERLTVTVDPAVVRAGNEAVRAGRAESLSGWVNLAMTELAERERRLQAMREAVRLYEREFGAISAAEMAAQERADRRNGVFVRARTRPIKRRKRSRAA